MHDHPTVQDQPIVGNYTHPAGVVKSTPDRKLDGKSGIRLDEIRAEPNSDKTCEKSRYQQCLCVPILSPLANSNDANV